MKAWYLSRILLTSWGVWLLTCGCTPSGPEPEVGTRRMVQHLEQIAAHVNADTNPYVNMDRVQLFRQRVAQLQDSGTTASGRRREQLLEARFALAAELLRAGLSVEAAEEYRSLLTYAGSGPFRLTLRTLVGVSHLRDGEQQNCILRHTIDSCLLPIGSLGVHQVPEGSRAAAAEFLAVLAENPHDLTARWLLNIAAMTLGEWPDGVPAAYLIPPAAFASDYDIGRFEDVASAVGVDAVGLSGGAVMEDFDGDGHLDIMASSKGLGDQIRYFRNSANGLFEERTEAAGLLGIVGGLNTEHADYDNNGYNDVFVLRGAWLNADGLYPNSLLSNLDGEHFADVTEDAGLLTLHPTQTADWGDYDADGWLDLYVGNETLGSEKHPSELFRNNGADADPVGFTDVASASGVAVVGFVKAAVWGDYDNDGRLDLYVSRLLPNEANLLLRNEGPDAQDRWQFEDVTVQAGVPGPPYSFQTWFWDYDNDGWQDLFVSSFQGDVADVAADYLGLPHDGSMPRLYHNNGDGTFTDVTGAAGLDKPLLVMGSNFGDLDNDGFDDFYVGTGDPYMVTIVPNRMFRNAGDGSFQDVTTSGGFGHLQKGHGVAFGDLDHDGDQDVFAVMGGAYSGDVYQNVLFRNPGHANHWLKVQLEGRRSNRSAIGARIRLVVTTPRGERQIHATVNNGGSFGSSSLRQEIGLGQATAIRVLEVLWPDSGERQLFEEVEMDQLVIIREGDATPVRVAFDAFTLAGGGGAGQSLAPRHAAHTP